MNRHHSPALLTRRHAMAGIAAAVAPVASAVSQTLTPVKIAMIPTLDAGPILLAKQQGLFAKNGLDPMINLGGVGATIIPSVLSGEYPIGYANVISDLQAIDRGLPLLLIHVMYAAPADPQHDPYRVYIDPKGPIKDVKQLATANIGASTMKNLPEWLVRKSLENLGVADTGKIRWTRVTGEEAYSAVKSGQIDAVWLPQPMGAAAIANGLVPILNTNSGSIPNAVGGYYITSKAYAAAQPEVIARFNATMDAANPYATAHPQAAKDIVVKEAGFEPTLVQQADLNDYPNDLGLDRLKLIAADLIRYGLIRKMPDLDMIFWHPQ